VSFGRPLAANASAVQEGDMLTRSIHLVVTLLAATIMGCGSTHSTTQDASASDSPMDAMPDAPPGVERATLASGSSFTCASRGDATVACWGTNGDGDLGSPTAGPVKMPTSVSGLAHVASLFGNWEQTFVVLSDGSVSSWGDNDFGALGIGHPVTNSACGPTECELSPTATVIGSQAILAIGMTHGCTVGPAHVVECWGDNTYGQVGEAPSTAETCRFEGLDYPYPCRRSPQPVPGLTDVVDVSAGWYFSCAVRADGSVWCWGDDQNGQLGSSTSGLTTCHGPNNHACIASPVQVVGVTNATRVLASWGFACALLADGSVSCWGQNDFGQLGNGSTSAIPATSPTPVAGLARATSLSRGTAAHACAVIDDGSVACWGHSSFGEGGRQGNQLCNGDACVSAETISGLDHITQVTTGGSFSCAVRDDGTVWCWGNNLNYQLGDGTDLPHSQPVQVNL
jgi:alpha-tubulin suppressor-like RCC1 family protein